MSLDSRSWATGTHLSSSPTATFLEISKFDSALFCPHYWSIMSSLLTTPLYSIQISHTKKTKRWITRRLTAFMVKAPGLHTAEWHLSFLQCSFRRRVSSSTAQLDMPCDKWSAYISIFATSTLKIATSPGPIQLMICWQLPEILPFARRFGLRTLQTRQNFSCLEPFNIAPWRYTNLITCSLHLHSSSCFLQYCASRQSSWATRHLAAMSRSHRSKSLKCSTL